MFDSREEAQEFAVLRDRLLGYPKVTQDGEFQTADAVTRKSGKWTTASCREQVIERLSRPTTAVRLVEEPQALDEDGNPTGSPIRERTRILELLDKASNGEAAHARENRRIKREAREAKEAAQAAKLAELQAMDGDALLTEVERPIVEDAPPEVVRSDLFRAIQARFPDAPDELIERKETEALAARERRAEAALAAERALTEGTNGELQAQET